MGKRSRLVAVFSVIAAAALLAGCTAPASAPTPKPASVQAPGSSPAPAKTASAEPQYDPAGTAKDNLAYFDLVNKRVLSANPGALGRDLVDNLVTAGFDRSAMQVTPDTTPRRHNTDSIEFSVRIGTECLLGQIIGGTYSSVVGPDLEGGTCLIGKTRAIDW